jgi:hypothetical protein
MKDSVHQGPRKSTPRKIVCLEGLTPPERQYEAAPAYTVREDGTEPVRRLYTLACQLRFIG